MTAILTPVRMEVPALMASTHLLVIVQKDFLAIIAILVSSHCPLHNTLDVSSGLVHVYWPNNDVSDLVTCIGDLANGKTSTSWLEGTVFDSQSNPKYLLCYDLINMPKIWHWWRLQYWAEWVNCKLPPSRGCGAPSQGTIRLGQPQGQSWLEAINWQNSYHSGSGRNPEGIDEKSYQPITWTKLTVHKLHSSDTDT